MIHARSWLDSPCVAQVAAARAVALLDQVSDAVPVLLYGAPLLGSCVSVGVHQRTELALRAGSAPADVVRRSSGGNAVYAGEGVFHLAMALRDASALMDCPPGRILNRNVRGLLQGLRFLAVPAHYFGRDYVSVMTRPGVYVAWDEREDGRVLLEAFISVERSYVPPADWIGYPPRVADPFRGHAPITLHEAAKRVIEPGVLFEQIVRGHAVTYGIDVSPLEAAAIDACTMRAAHTKVAVATDDDGLCWSAPYEEAIGFVYAGVAVDAERRLARARVGGDYFQNRQGQAALEQALVGCTADGTALGHAINRVYGDTQHVIEGIRQMDSLRAVVLSAAQGAEARQSGA